jgi:hypothetical protein
LGGLPEPWRRETGAVSAALLLSLPDLETGAACSLRRSREGSTKAYLPAVIKSYIAVPNEVQARQLEVYFKSGSGKAFAKKRLLSSRMASPEPMA